MKKLIFFFFKEKYYPYFVPIFLVIISYILYYNGIININNDLKLNDIIANVITIGSIIVGLLTASLAIIMQIDGNNDNIRFLRQNNLLNLLYSYFKIAITISLFTVLYSLILLIFTKRNDILIFTLILGVLFIGFSTYRCVSLIFKILKKE